MKSIVGREEMIVSAVVASWMSKRIEMTTWVEK